MWVCFLHQVSFGSPALRCSLPTPLHVSDLRTKIIASSLTSSCVSRYFSASYKALFLSCDLVSIISLFTPNLISEVRREREVMFGAPSSFIQEVLENCCEWNKDYNK